MWGITAKEFWFGNCQKITRCPKYKISQKDFHGASQKIPHTIKTSMSTRWNFLVAMLSYQKVFCLGRGGKSGMGRTLSQNSVMYAGIIHDFLDLFQSV